MPCRQVWSPAFHFPAEQGDVLWIAAREGHGTMHIACLRICTYQPVEGGSTDEPIWEKGRGKGMPWHKEFILDLPNDDPDTAMREPENDDPRFHTDVYEVKAGEEADCLQADSPLLM